MDAPRVCAGSRQKSIPGICGAMVILAAATPPSTQKEHEEGRFGYICTYVHMYEPRKINYVRVDKVMHAWTITWYMTKALMLSWSGCYTAVAHHLLRIIGFQPDNALTTSCRTPRLSRRHNARPLRRRSANDASSLRGPYNGRPMSG